MGRRTYNKHQLPKCPDPEKYVRVDTREGSYWRRKRGTVKEAVLNTAFEENNRLVKRSGPAAKRLKDKLSPYTRELRMGRMTLQFSRLLMQTLKEKGSMDYSLLKGVELNPDYPLDPQLPGTYNAIVEKGSLSVNLEWSGKYYKRLSQQVSHYYFDLLLLFGDPENENSLRVELETSPLFGVDLEEDVNYKFNITLPEEGIPWMVMLKMSRLENSNEPALNARHYGMKVIATGV